MQWAPELTEISANAFVDYCIGKFGWTDLSRDVVMEVECGEHAYCAKAVLAKFPDVREITGIDKDPKVTYNYRMNATTRIDCAVADIEKSDSLEEHEGRITKVLSAHKFHRITMTEEALSNVYCLLKPGGEAALLLIAQQFVYEWLKAMAKWRHFAFKIYKNANSYKYQSESGYKELAEKIGFQVVDCTGEERVIQYASDEECKEALYERTRKAFKVPPKARESFKEQSFEEFVRIMGRDKEGRPRYRYTEFSLLLAKPKAGSLSKM